MTRETIINENKFVDPDHRMRKISYIETGHVPFNKRSWEAHGCSAILAVTDYDGSKPENAKAWTEISLTELQTNIKGRVVSRTITLTLDGDNRKVLIELLSREPAVA